MIRNFVFLLLALLPIVTAAQVTLRAPDGGGAYHLNANACLRPEQARRIQETIDANIQELQASGKFSQHLQADVKLGWPLKPSVHLTQPGYYGISNFVDHAPGYPDDIYDYTCGDRTYDLASGYNHGGTDIFLWPFSWQMMDNNEVEVVAAAEGTIVYKEQKHPDRSCVWDPSTTSWNAVYIRHADGRVAWYGHLKQGSITQKGIGDHVLAGEYLGLVGSSGFSSGPHLHFELRNGNSVVDPWAGDCNLTSSVSLWQQQKPYYESSINRIATHYRIPTFADCPGTVDIPAYADTFAVSREFFVTSYFHDQLNSEQAEYRILRPNGSVYDSWTHTTSQPHYRASFWYWRINLPSNQPEGNWKLTTTYASQTVEHTFVILNTAIHQYSPFAQIAPEDETTDLGGLVHFSWDASAVMPEVTQLQIASDSRFLAPEYDYFVYNGLDTTIKLDSGLYFWRIKPYYPFSTQGWSPTWSFTTLGEKGSVEENNDGGSSVTLYPNPAGDELFVTSYTGYYMVIDAVGRIVLEGTLETPSIKIQSLRSGIYTFIAGNNSKRFIKL